MTDRFENLRIQSARADKARMKQHHEEVRWAISHVRNIRAHRESFDRRYMGGSARCEYDAMARLSRLVSEWRAFATILAHRAA